MISRSKFISHNLEYPDPKSILKSYFLNLSGWESNPVDIPELWVTEVVKYCIVNFVKRLLIIIISAGRRPLVNIGLPLRFPEWPIIVNEIFVNHFRVYNHFVYCMQSLNCKCRIIIKIKLFSNLKTRIFVFFLSQRYEVFTNRMDTGGLKNKYTQF